MIYPLNTDIRYTTKILSPLAKVFPDEPPKTGPERTLFTALKNETVSFQVAYSFDSQHSGFARVAVESPIAKQIRVREVILVPAAYPCHTRTDDNYVRKTPGLFPDLLRELHNSMVIIPAGQWRSLWVDVEVAAQQTSGVYPVTVLFLDHETGLELCCAQTTITIYDAVLPEQTLIRTEWFHGDCLSDYYKFPVFSEEHWVVMERFIALAVKRGVNMILTPQFTPPLDTAKGGDRTAIQLVDVVMDNGVYSFDFTKMKRWVDMCLNAGIRYFEMSHLFTQWGATAAPKIMAVVDGVSQQLFGWDSLAVGGEYTQFLHEYIPALITKLREWRIEKNTMFHISDEPTLEQIESYMAAKGSVAGLLEGFPIIDALSDYNFYKAGAVVKPVCAIDHIHTFLENGAEHLWSYYCTTQCLEVSNRFMAMPSARNRIYGVQLFKYDIEGILHWGYNFYNSFNSAWTIDPYQVTDSAGCYPSGDPFLVYPDDNGYPEESIRCMVQYHAMADLRAMQYLKQLTNKDFVMGLIEEDLSQPITFREYPKSDDYLLTLRNRINCEIADRL